jgi:tRNA threonylcarbamoyl adenosine modification protein YeaZ
MIVFNHTVSMTKHGLALHTSTPELGLAIAALESDANDRTRDHDFNDAKRTSVWDLGRETSTLLHTYILEFIAPQTWQELAWIAVAHGPGGFTGTRLAAVTAKTIGQQLQIPVYGISNLAAVAWQQQIEGDLAVVMPAQQGQIYTGVYRTSHLHHTIEVLEIDRLTTPAAWQEYSDKFSGSKIILESGAKLGHTVDSVWDLAQLQWQRGEFSTWQNLTPFYG